MTMKLPELPFKDVVVEGLWERQYGPYTEEDMLSFGRFCTTQTLDAAAAKVESMTPAESNCVWEAAYKVVGEDHAAAIRAMKTA